ncbi:hypothetical protein COV15_01750 [Candidatus Woesearchaeota archaeon CG10_big_fil_rev_8_21_14_0_10_34_12]|nr:MAG: hypothetical protein COV15_01750 [Candidatus Woesearchaeota archaeon CG10_big_fil_rev_8_21_14_0_10_34_12]
MVNFNPIYNPKKIYKEMLKDIMSAKECICLETYIFDKDKTGNRFLKAMVKKAKEGVKIKLFIDAWGSSAKREYFEELIKLGGEVKFFREFRYVIRIFSKNHERNHRKLLIIDNKIVYVGSANITKNCLNWRELTLRMEGDIAKAFARSFFQSWETSGKINKKRIKRLFHEGFEIIQDIPSPNSRQTEKEYIRLISKAKKEIIIETPYFVPSSAIRSAFSEAIKRKVNVKIMTPYISKPRIVDIVRTRYIGKIHETGIKIYYYPKMLHSKLLIIDNDFFLLGSSNLDYRSFMHQFEINLLGKDKEIIKKLRKNFNKTLKKCKPFNYNGWKKRSSLKKLLELLLEFTRKYL